MKLKFTKMQGIGNDFVVIDAINQKVELSTEQVKHIADRRFGVGCDQILLVEAPSSPDVAFRYRILNADGSEVAQCGNGARCFARFVTEKGLINEPEFLVETQSGIIILQIQEDGEVLVNMGEPDFTPANIPLDFPEEQSAYAVRIEGETINFGAVSMGNPHAVITVADVDTAPVLTLGPILENHPLFPERCNIGFMQILAPDHIRLRVYERGTGETLACGSGACAAVAIGQRQHKLADQVKVDLPGGSLKIEWQGESSPVIMTGAAETVFEGKIKI
ncbi:MAG: diaminopimelate epimerase [Thiotrichales bacterium]